MHLRAVRSQQWNSTMRDVDGQPLMEAGIRLMTGRRQLGNEASLAAVRTLKFPQLKDFLNLT